MPDDAYMTAAELRAIRNELESSMPGYEPPAAYGLGVAREAAPTHFPVRNVGDAHLLPAAVLASITGYRPGTSTWPLTREQLASAVTELEPAGRCLDFEHPNLWAWQQIQRDLDAGMLRQDAQLVAVFIEDLADPAEDQHQRDFRAAAGLDP